MASPLHLDGSDVNNNSSIKDLENIVEDVEIPVIDFSLLTEGTPDQRYLVVQELAKACEDWGFFVLVNHGVPDKLRNALMDTFKGFFNLPPEDKQDSADTHAMNPIRYGTSFNAKVDDNKYWREYLKVMTHPEFHCPTKPPQFREELKEYSACIRELGKKLLGGIWEGLGLDNNYMREALNLGNCFQIVVGNHYAPCPQPEKAMGLPPHSDHGLISILYQNDVDGLEVQHDGKWVRVKPLPNSYLINTGDQMEIVSNGKYKSIVHRAAVNEKRARMSIVTVTGPSLDTTVVAAPQLVSGESPATFRGMKYGEFMEYQQGHGLQEKSVLKLLRL
ncbi:uncharacterized protein A4U43_C04F14360 [Asparagus officinalis]|uniref:Fe2OG dioxygenase domain-containing protein n=1 Tax=Asparagus officinalis TaxID=4686 RepID=A0A5P1F0T9_ASPOF|nr:protein DMR6-LIKE OXYGENASE 1-like [Asparagus officinalis]ONK71975.1 uncharacterized protein A4U43_C04F14360 [Asparagus officinalis]